MANYPGNKNFGNTIHFLVNRLPRAHRNFSLFMGSGGLENSVYTSGAKWICADPNDKCHEYESDQCILAYEDYRVLISDFEFTHFDFIFADPPYLLETRSSGKKYYKYEFSIQDHIEFLDHIGRIDAKIMITHPKCDLYDEALKDWSKEEFSYMTRNGWFTDCLYTNYNTADIELLNYECLGEDFVDRQRIKRQRKNIINKFKNLEPKVRAAIIEEMKRENIIGTS